MTAEGGGSVVLICGCLARESAVFVESPTTISNGLIGSSLVMPEAVIHALVLSQSSNEDIRTSPLMSGATIVLHSDLAEIIFCLPTRSSRRASSSMTVTFYV